jgi:hypothetical protein
MLDSRLRGNDGDGEWGGEGRGDGGGGGGGAGGGGGGWGRGACPYAVFRKSGPPCAPSVTIPSLSRFPSESSKKPRETGGASRRRVFALSRPCRGTLPPPGGGEQASAEARFGRRRVRYPRPLRSAAVPLLFPPRPFGARRFPCFLPSPPWSTTFLAFPTLPAHRA